MKDYLLGGCGRWGAVGFFGGRAADPDGRCATTNVRSPSRPRHLHTTVPNGMRVSGKDKPDEPLMTKLQQEAAALNYTANSATGANILADKWNQPHKDDLTTNGDKWDAGLVHGFPAAWWTGNPTRKAVKPPERLFCTADNECDPSKVGPDDKNERGPSACTSGDLKC
ncbi:hypothetical protein [Streptomyces sp. 769]|uniref:hypothetical protein n=1 Tax=Streptomyces sp. 769 TaxID=1262452 RepID=UPI000581BB2F|nr:hypothetical protein [Streptomyces sp. 769]AJC53901.1 hypothetical protein GZL_01301 [Streptomyces sp. 769]